MLSSGTNAGASCKASLLNYTPCLLLDMCGYVSSLLFMPSPLCTCPCALAHVPLPLSHSN